MKIVELFLDDLQDISGLDGIALVEKPAHESNWLAFAEDENQKNIYEVLTPEQLYDLAIELNKLGEPVGYLESQGWKLQKIEPIKNQMAFAINIISNPNEDSGEDSELAYRIRYKYSGPKDKKNRAFCSEMMRQNRVFRREDIDDMTEALSNPQFGYYSIWNFRGSFNCRHYWNKLTYRWEGEIINKSSNPTNRTGVEQIPNEPTITTATANSKDAKEKEKQARRIQTSAETFKVIEVIDDMPLFTTQEEAELMAEILGCKGSHQHELKDGTIGYMPCEKHLFQSYNDYPQAASDNACKVLKWIDEHGRDEVSGMELTGLQRANSLCKREKITRETIARMASFERHRKNSTINPEFKGTPWKDKGYVAWLAWGGDEGVAWAQRKLEEIDKEEMDIDVSGLSPYTSPTGKTISQEMAKVGPRGGIKDSKKAPKSDTPNKDPKGEGTAKGNASNTRSAKVDAATEETLTNKSDDWNERYKEKRGYGTNVGMLKAVYQRGLGAYNTSHSPAIKSAKGWAMARVNSFLLLMKDGRPSNAKYTTDYDLLPAKHPKSEKKMNAENVDTGAANLAVPLTTRGRKTQIVPMSKSMFSYDEDKMQITGAAIIPNKMIIRRSQPTADKPNGEIYYVFFSEQTTRKLAEKFIAKDKLLDATNIEHIDALSAESYVIESWIVEDSIYDKSAALGLSYPKGTWVITMQVKNPSVWKQIKAGKLNGFSVQGWFAENLLFN